ncbi:Crp/Fnr family transcriptional regulator [Hymenobacter saemangeumensis]|uniref:Crp/Fnr family transcriptional regulator n=1 Tax=Hymenobacter saemangeumensis TaxID=1084522 RepID=A0ABP8HZ55_9BACT
MPPAPDFAAPARQLLTALLSQVPYLPPAEIAEFAGLWTKEVALKRGDFLVHPGQTEQFLYFIHHGLLRIYYPTASEEICVGFGHANTLICSFPSFAAGRPSEYAIQALRQSALIAVSRRDFQAFLDGSPAFARFWRFELEKALVGRMEHEIDLLMPEPAHRLERLRRRSPHIFQHVPKKYLASYLRMSAETLSRLRF